jgi:hypothetical protein
MHVLGAGHRSFGVISVVAIHVLIAAAWMSNRPELDDERTGVARIQWLRSTPVERQLPAPALGAHGKTRSEVASKPSDPRITTANTKSVAGPNRPESNNDEVQVDREPAPVEFSRDDDLPASTLLDRARRLAGNADRDARRESGTQVAALSDTTNARFLSGLEAATARKWHGIAKITETTMPGTGERLYKISNGTDTYCVRIPSPSVGIDRYEWERNNFHPILCPK